MKNLKMTYKIWVLNLAFTLGSVIVGINSFSTLNEVKVTGPHYVEIIRDNVLLADILPPPAYILESYLNVLQVVREKDEEARKPLLEKAAQLRTDFETRHAYWDKDLPEGPQRKLMLEDAYKPAMEFYEVRDKEFFPAVEEGNWELAEELANGKLAETYQVHRTVIDEIVKQAVAAAAEHEKSALAALGSGNQMFWMLSIGINLLVIAFAYWLSRRIVAPLNEVAGTIESVASGDLTKRVSYASKDEIGRIGVSLNRTVDGMKTSFGADKVDWEEIARQKAQKAEAERREKEGMENLKRVLDTVGKNASGIAAASEELSSVSMTMSDNATQTSSQTQLVAGSAESVSRNVQTVAAGAEQMTASIREISKNASEAAKIANNAVRVAQTTNVSVSKLGDSSQEIGEVIKVINSIAEQTNLLALNATIEAARAGEAGKGFAVVANEVKELAKETSKATENISRKIEGIQGDTKTAVDAIAEISSVINQINEISNSIAAAVEEQTATTNEMGRNLGEAARSSAEMVQSLGSVTQAAQSTTSGASDTQKAAAELAKMASELQQVVMR